MCETPRTMKTDLFYDILIFKSFQPFQLTYGKACIFSFLLVEAGIAYVVLSA